jgi:putative transposase
MLSYSKNPNSTKELWYLFDKYHYLDLYEMRDIWVTKNDSLNDWEYNTPKDIRRDAIHTFITSVKTNLKKKSKFQTNYKTKKSPNQTIGGISKSAVKKTDNGFLIYSSYTNKKIFKLKTRTKKRLKNFNNIEGDCTLTFNGINYYLLVPFKKTVKDKKDNKDCVSLDPGVRTFQTIFSNKEVLKISSRDELIKKLYVKIDSLKSKNKENCYRKRILKCNEKIRNIVNDIHCKTVTYLKNNYNDILLPSFDSQDMVTGYLHSSTKRLMNSLSHFQFKQRLLNTCKELKNFRVYIVNEAYTTITCSNCGTLKKMGGLKTYNCNNCLVSIDRDINGARGILLKHLL